MAHKTPRRPPKPEDLDALTEKLRGLIRDESGNAWDIGHALEEVAGGAYLARHKTFDEYVARELDYSRRRAFALRRVSRRFERDPVVTYGWSKLDLVIRIWEFLPGEEDAARLDEFEFPTADGAKRLADLSQDDMEAFVEHLRDQRDQGDVGKLPRAARSTVAYVRRAMRTVKGFRIFVSVPKGRQGLEDARVTILGLPIRQASSLGKLLVEGARHAGLVRTKK